MKKINCLIVLGMHRSGTSVLTGCLNLLGINLGRSLMPAYKNNPTGHWENQDLVIVHEILLKDLGCNWHLVGTLPDDWLASEAAERAGKNIRHLLSRHYSRKRIWAFKDPRICRLLPLWLPILEDMGYYPGFIMTLRHPLEVAKSLNKRNGFSLKKGLLLWFLHNRDAFAACRGRPVTLLTYDQFLNDPLSALRSVARDLDLEFPKPWKYAVAEILDFVQPGFKNQHIGFAAHDETFGVDSTKKSELYSRLYNQIRKNIHNHKQQLPDLFEISDALFEDLLAYTGDQERIQLTQEFRKEKSILAKPEPVKNFMAHVFFPQPTTPVYTDAKTHKFVLSLDQWQQISCDIPNPSLLSSKPLRLDPLNTNGVIRIASVSLTNRATGETLLHTDKPEAFQSYRASGNAFILPDQETFTLFSFAHDPQLIFPTIPDIPDCPLILSIWIKISVNQKIILQIWEKMKKKCEIL